MGLSSFQIFRTLQLLDRGFVVNHAPEILVMVLQLELATIYRG